jgi:hypothetical protein
MNIILFENIDINQINRHGNGYWHGYGYGNGHGFGDGMGIGDGGGNGNGSRGFLRYLYVSTNGNKKGNI